MVAVKDNMNGDPCMLVSEHVCFLLSDVLTDISRTEISTVSLSLLPLPPISLSLSLPLFLRSLVLWIPLQQTLHPPTIST